MENTTLNKRQSNEFLVAQAKNGDKAAQDELFVLNQKLIWSIVKRFMGRGVEANDLFQIGSIGFIKAVERFDVSFNTQFSTYAVPMIIGEIKRFLRDDSLIKVSRSLKELSKKAMFVKDELMREFMREPTINEIADKMGVDPAELAAALEATSDTQSLDQTVSPDDSRQVFDKIPADVDFSEQVLNSVLLHDALKSFPPRDLQIIDLRYFRQKTQTEIAEILGISQVQVSRLEKKILNSLREKIS